MQHPPRVAEQGVLGNRRRRGPMQGGKTFEHKILKGERGAKLVHSVGGRFEVKEGMERGMGGAEVRGDDLEAPHQRQSKSIGEDIVSARWLVRPGGEAGRHQILTTPCGGNRTKVGPPLRG